MSSWLPRRPLGNTGLTVSPLGMAGSYGLDADATERGYEELGLNYFFTIPSTKGLLGGVQRLIKKGKRDDLVIGAGANLPTGFGVEGAFAKTAKLLGVEVIDVFHLFWVQAHWYVTGKTWSAMRKLKEEGKVRSLAISCHDRTMARALVDELGLDVLMIRYNAAHRGAEREIFATLGEGPAKKAAVVAYTATRWGGLLKPTKGLGPMSAPECYRFAAAHPAVDVVLCGAKDWHELSLAAEGIRQGPLAPERLTEVLQFGDTVRSTAASRLAFGGA